MICPESTSYRYKRDTCGPDVSRGRDECSILTWPSMDDVILESRYLRCEAALLCTMSFVEALLVICDVGDQRKDVKCMNLSQNLYVKTCSKLVGKVICIPISTADTCFTSASHIRMIETGCLGLGEDSYCIGSIQCVHSSADSINMALIPSLSLCCLFTCISRLVGFQNEVFRRHLYAFGAGCG